MRFIKGRWQPVFGILLCALVAVAFVARDVPARAQDEATPVATEELTDSSSAPADTGLGLDEMTMPSMPGPVAPEPIQAPSFEEALPATPPPAEALAAEAAESDSPSIVPSSPAEQAPQTTAAPVEGYYAVGDAGPAHIAVSRGVGVRPSRHWPKEAREEAAIEAVFSRQVALEAWNRQVPWHMTPMASGAAWMSDYVGHRSTPATASGQPQGQVRGMPDVQVRGLLYAR